MDEQGYDEKKQRERPRGGSSLSTSPFSLSLSLSRARLPRILSPFLSLTNSETNAEQQTPKNQKLTTESAWKLFVYFTLTALAAASTAPFGFFLHTPDFWQGCTKFPPCNYQITRPMGLAYALELGELRGKGGKKEFRGESFSKEKGRKGKNSK